MQVGALNSYWTPLGKNYLVKGEKEKQKNEWGGEQIWEFM